MYSTLLSSPCSVLECLSTNLNTDKIGDDQESFFGGRPAVPSILPPTFEIERGLLENGLHSRGPCPEACGDSGESPECER